jgi:hypothetical protein
VEFAVAPDGVIHAISNAPDAPAVDRSIADLAAASAWVHVNEGLLRASIPELARRTLVIQTREHLVTTHPKQARRLLDTHVKVHVPHGASGFLDLN